MAPKPKVPPIIKRANNVQTDQDVLNMFKAMASRMDHYKEHGTAVADIIESKQIVASSEIVGRIISEGIKSLKNYGYVHPKLRACIVSLPAPEVPAEPTED